MTNKPLCKLLSTTLAIAICVTTVFGCLLTANALDIPSYVITGANCTKGQTTASAMVEFTANEGIAGGNFIIDNEIGWYSSVEASFSGMPNADTDQIVVDTNIRDNKATVLFYITDEGGSAKNYTTVTLKQYIVNGTKVYDSKELEYTVYSDAVCEVCGEAKGSSCC